MFDYEAVIVIPYRDRPEQLSKFIRDIVPLFRRYMNTFKVVIVEQEPGKPFNRGKLLNIGFTEYKHKTPFFVTQDVDTQPNEECIRRMYTNTKFEVLRIYNGHDRSLGGITKLSTRALLQMNGFPNHIWGWGIEDRSLFYRSVIAKVRTSPNLTNGIFFNVYPHISNIEAYTGEKKAISDLEDEIFNCGDITRQINHISVSGLNNMEYNILEIEHITIDVVVIRVSL
jgi:hypothetical protein